MKTQLQMTKDLMKKNPNLTPDGLRNKAQYRPQDLFLTDVYQNQISKCIEWIKAYAEPQKTVSKKLNSYNFKHDVEFAFNEYIANGSFIIAAYILGYESNNEHCPSFNMKVKHIDANRYGYTTVFEQERKLGVSTRTYIPVIDWKR
jgi:hypothetical protein